MGLQFWLLNVFNVIHSFSHSAGGPGLVPALRGYRSVYFCKLAGTWDFLWVYCGWSTCKQHGPSCPSLLPLQAASLLRSFVLRVTPHSQTCTESYKGSVKSLKPAIMNTNILQTNPCTSFSHSTRLKKMPVDIRILWIIWSLIYPIPWPAWHRGRPCLEMINKANPKMEPPLMRRQKIKSCRTQITLQKSLIRDIQVVYL